MARRLPARPWQAGRRARIGATIAPTEPEPPPLVTAERLAELATRDALRFRRLVRHLHRLGPRPTGELLLEVADDRDRLLERLEHLARFTPAQIAALGADDWLDLKPRRCA